MGGALAALGTPSSPGPARSGGRRCCERSRSRLRARDDAGQMRRGHPHAQGGVAAAWHIPGALLFPGWPARVARSRPICRKRPCITPTGPSPHDRDSPEIWKNRANQGRAARGAGFCRKPPVPRSTSPRTGALAGRSGRFCNAFPVADARPRTLPHRRACACDCEAPCLEKFRGRSAWNNGAAACYSWCGFVDQCRITSRWLVRSPAIVPAMK